MQIVIADTGPVNYLILVGCIDLLPTLFGQLILPLPVCEELASPKAPLEVRQWIASPPAWVDIREVSPDQLDDVSLRGIDQGEKAAITLALALQADLLLMDDRKGVRVAEAKGLVVTGTLGVLDLAARRELIDFSHVADRLQQTNFRRPQIIIDNLLEEQKRRGGKKGQ